MVIRPHRGSYVIQEINPNTFAPLHYKIVDREITRESIALIPHSLHSPPTYYIHENPLAPPCAPSTTERPSDNPISPRAIIAVSHAPTYLA
eukprot:2183826-Prymnesium_polylepis.1